MECIYTEDSWYEIVTKQEELLQYDYFDRTMALELGLLIEQITREKYHGSVAIRIIEEDNDIFSYRMPNSVKDADWWMNNKYINARFIRMSSLRALILAKQKRLFPEWTPWNQYLCGGCIPVFNRKGGRPFAYVVISGMKHYEDHEIIAEAMAKQLQIDIPHIVRHI
ncbi:MAG: heme-binding protein [Traorella sp.]